MYSTRRWFSVAQTGRRRAVKARRTRSTALRTLTPAIGLVAMLGAAVAAVVQSPTTSDVAAAVEQTDVLAAAAAQPPTSISRSAERAPIVTEAEAAEEVEGRLYATESLAVHADSSSKSPELATIAAGDQVAVTGESTKNWTQIMHNDAPRWVVSAGLTEEEPLGTRPCPYLGEGGLQPDTVKVLRAVCEKYPSITSYGGIAGRGEHATGHSLDIMVSSDLGNDIAAFLQDNRAELGVEYLIWRQRIWRPATSPDWRGMSDRGGATANHFDHVHVTTYGTAATSG